MEHLRFPVGRFDFQADYSADDISQWIEVIAAFPAKLEELAAELTEEQLSSTYRPEGWTIRQVINHVADSHINAYGRFKRVVTEDIPTINPYDQDLWAELDDGKNGDIAISVTLLNSLHNRWVRFMRSKPADIFERTYNHPEHPGTQKLIFMLQMYAWHCEHHLGHVRIGIEN